MTGICIPTSADIRIEVAGRRVAVVQSYRGGVVRGRRGHRLE